MKYLNNVYLNLSHQSVVGYRLKLGPFIQVIYVDVRDQIKFQATLNNLILLLVSKI